MITIPRKKVKVQLKGHSLVVTIKKKIALRQDITQGDELICEEHVCGGLIFRKAQT